MKQRAVLPYAVAVVVTALVILVAYMALFVPRLQQTSATDQKASQQAAANSKLDAKLTTVKTAAAGLGSMVDTLTAFQKSFPASPGEEDLFGSIVAAGAAAGVNVAGINPTAPSTKSDPGTAAKAPAAGPTPSASASASTDASDPALAQAKATPAQGAAQAGAAAAAGGAGPLAQINLTVSASGTPAGLQQFVKNLEQLQRPFMVKTITLSASGPKGNLSVTGVTWISAPLPVPAVPGR